MQKKKIKICFFIIDAYPLFKKCEGAFGGAEIDLYLLAARLAQKNGYEVEFVVGDFGQPAEEIIENVKVIKCRYLNIEKYKSKYFAVMRRINFFKTIFKSNADIYFTETASEFAFYMAVISKLHRKLMVYRTAHDEDCDGNYIRNFGFRGRLYGYAIKLFDQIISQNNIQQHMWRKYEQKKLYCY